TKGEESPDMGAHGPHFTGVHHFGFEVDDLDEACAKLEGAHGQRLTAKDHIDTVMQTGGHANFEMKWSGPDGVVIDISHTGWEGTGCPPPTSSVSAVAVFAERLVDWR